MKKLHSSENDRIIGGVCGGISETYDVDVSLVRLLFVVISIFYGTGIIIYITLMLILPKGDDTDKPHEIKEKTPSKATIYRLREGKMVAGICSGFADKQNTDVSLVRLAVVLVTVFSSGIPIILYIVLWIIIPYRD